ncbi:AN1-type zinc finger protein 4 [Denticeps clupeoides]|uniref:AN1-type zinc finger protein 4 n=1 Tax=Denticeps clupeoides TaxID=299321 RepID=A0AAY4ET31_9TELE|nr:AN1-type zinc finger protein 4 [Denticeps clupeoides]
MAQKKEPPFLNNDNAGSVSYKLPFYETIELFIETLTGTCFELPVSPFETVISVKAKIQRLEGIPIAQQHLIWNNVELEDECCLHDYNITEGCTLKLVLAMRGGPINTRRVTVDDTVKEMAEYMDAGGEELWEKASSNKQMTFLVYREGDQLNFFRVVDHCDGTLTPVSESISGGGAYSMYADEEESDNSLLGQQALENSITMTKMKLLKAKMESMNLNKKPKKILKMKPRPPVGPRPCSSSIPPSRQQRYLQVLPQIGQCQASAVPLPPIRDQFHQLTPTGTTHLSHLPQGECSISRIRPPPKVSRLDLGRPKLIKDCVYPSLPVIGQPDGAMDDTIAKGDGDMLDEVQKQEGLPFSGLLQEPLSIDLPMQKDGSLDSLETISKQIPAAPLLSQAVESNSLGTWMFGGEGAGLSTLHLPSETLSSSPHIHHLPAPSLSLAPTTTNAFCSTKVASPSRHSEVTSSSDAWDITKLANKASRMPLGSVSGTELVGSLACRRNQEGLAGRLFGAGAALPANIHQFQEDLLRRLSPLQQPAASYVSSSTVGPSPMLTTSIRRLGTPTYHLPPVKALISSKKSSKHCFLCGKKTGLATSYECRCGNNFCASHRYAEIHDCTYDYKSTGRRFLQETNPLISAPKLPKI